MTKVILNLFMKKEKDNTDSPKVRNKMGTIGGVVGIICNVILFALKFFAGIVTGAISITADAFNNLADAASSVITLIGFYIAGKPADEDHPFGHGRMEYVSGFVVALAILMMGFELLQSAIGKIIDPEDIHFQVISVVILVVSILVKFWMASFNKYVGNLIDSETLRATAKDSLFDCISTAAVLVGLLLYRFAELNLDGWFGLLVAGFVLWGGYGTVKDTVNPLLGETPDAELVKAIEDMVLHHDTIIGVHDMIIHDYGPGRRIVSLHAEVPANVDILEAHDLIDHVEKRIMQEYLCEATIHMDPVVIDDDEINCMRHMAERIVKDYNDKLSIHDFRMVKGNTHTNVIFDLVIPYGKEYEVKDIVAKIRQRVQETLTKEMNHTIYAVIQVDRLAV